MNLESQKVTVQKSQSELFQFLSNVENYEQLMPDNLTKFEKVNDETFSFQLKGMPEIQLEIIEKQEPDFIKLGSTNKSLDFSLDIRIEAEDANSSSAQLFFEGKFNMMMAMMVKKPLSSFIDTLSNNLKKTAG
ncbi:MAG TPA: SRPBCC family protein [Salinimicrobium sp.]|nr:SRPBCC family protein [Salinimicrobium sp.]